MERKKARKVTTIRKGREVIGRKEEMTLVEEGNRGRKSILMMFEYI